MNGTHTTADGETMLIAQMSNNHLVNTINRILRKIETAKKGLDAKVDIPKFKSVLYRIDQEDISESAVEQLEFFSEALPPYLAEAMVRGISFTEELQRVFDRTDQHEERFEFSSPGMLTLEPPEGFEENADQ